jgi:hypothetical protein
MAGYPRKLLSLELALKNIIKELKKDEIKEITGKSESHFQKQNQILLGYIDYDYANFIDGGERKIRKIGINPNQKEIIKLNIGDRLITLSHY